MIQWYPSDDPPDSDRLVLIAARRVGWKESFYTAHYDEQWWIADVYEGWFFDDFLWTELPQMPEFD